MKIDSATHYYIWRKHCFQYDQKRVRQFVIETLTIAGISHYDNDIRATDYQPLGLDRKQPNEFHF